MHDNGTAQAVVVGKMDHAGRARATVVARHDQTQVRQGGNTRRRTDFTELVGEREVDQPWSARHDPDKRVTALSGQIGFAVLVAGTKCQLMRIDACLYTGGAHGLRKACGPVGCFSVPQAGFGTLPTAGDLHAGLAVGRTPQQ